MAMGVDISNAHQLKSDVQFNLDSAVLATAAIAQDKELKRKEVEAAGHEFFTNNFNVGKGVVIDDLDIDYKKRKREI